MKTRFPTLFAEGKRDYIAGNYEGAVTKLSEAVEFWYGFEEHYLCSTLNSFLVFKWAGVDSALLFLLFLHLNYCTHPNSTSFSVAIYGEGAPEAFDALLFYGKALLEVGRAEDDLLNNAMKV